MAQLLIEFTKKIEIKNKLTVAKQDLKKILDDHPEYLKLMDARRILNNKLQQVLLETAESYPKLIDQIADLKVDLKSQDEYLNDCAVKDYLDKKDITIRDPNKPGIIYTPRLIIKYERSEDQTLFSKK